MRVKLKAMFLAVDIGGTKTLVAVFDTGGKVVEQEKFPTSVDYQEFLKELARAVKKLSTSKFAAAGVAAPGRIDRKTGIVVAFGNLKWQNTPIKQDVENMLNCPVVLENDSKLAALSEAQLLPKIKKVLYVTISTGISGGLIINGKLDPKFADIEVGHMLLEHQGVLMVWEDFASGRAFQQKFGKRVGDTDDKDTNAWYWLARNIAIGLIDLVATLNPDVIVIGGGVGSHLEKFKDRLEEHLKIYENPLLVIPPIVKARRAEDAVVYGCYQIAREHYEKAR